MVPFRLAGPTQPKGSRINFYPDKGMIYLDGDRAPLPLRGLQEFQELLHTNEGLIAAGIMHDPNQPLVGGAHS